MGTVRLFWAVSSSGRSGDEVTVTFQVTAGAGVAFGWGPTAGIEVAEDLAQLLFRQRLPAVLGAVLLDLLVVAAQVEVDGNI
jgi:hypothetical protein